MKQDLIPKWITIVCSLIFLLGFFVGCSLYLSPGTFIKNVDFSSSGARYLVHMWAARQIAIAVIIGFSVFRKSIPMLQVSLAAYSLMNVQDAVIGITQKDSGLIIGAAFFCVLSAVMCFRLSRLQSE